MNLTSSTVLGLIAPTLFCLQASAAPLAWDITSGDGAAITDGGGTWATGSGNWNDGTGNVNWVDGDSATFTGATGGTIAKTGAISQTGITFNGNANYVVNGSGSISGAGILTKNGTGSLTLSTVNGYSGGTTISQGTLQVGGTVVGAAGSGLITLGDTNTGANDISLELNCNAATQIGNSITVSADGTGVATIKQLLSNVAPYIYPVSGTVTLNRATTLQATGATGNCYTNVTGQITGNVGTLTVTGAETAAVGPRWVFSNTTNNFTGALVIAAGGEIGLNANEVIPNGTDVTVDGFLSVAKAGATSETIGALNGSGSIGDLANRGNLALTIGATGNNGDFSGVLSGIRNNMSLVKTGTGIQILGGINTYTGATTVNNGTLVINGSTHGSSLVSVTGGKLGGTGTINGSASISASGAIAPGDGGIGTLHVVQNLTLAGVAEFEVNKSGATLTQDQVEGFLNITYGGTLKVTTSGDSLAAGDSFRLFADNGGSYHDGFAVFDLPVLGGSLSWDTSSLAVDGTIRVVNHVGSPNFNPIAGGYVGAKSVTITSDSGSTIYYTTNGSTPTAASPSGPSPLGGIIVPVNTTLTIKAFARKSGQADSPVVAATYSTVATPVWTWDGTSSWAEPLNWQSGVIATGSGVLADFSTLTQSGDNVVTLDSSPTVGSLVFSDQGDAFGWTLGAGSSGSLTLDNGANSPLITVVNQTTAISAPIAGSNGFIKAGAGTLVLSGANTYGGSATLSTGTLKTTSDAALSSGPITINDANTGASDTTLTTSANTTVTPVRNNLIVANQGTGITTLELTLQNANFAGASIQLNKATTVQSNYDGVGGCCLGKWDDSSVISGNVGTLTLRALGTGMLYIMGDNTFSGTVQITQGTVATGTKAGALGSTNPVIMSGSATLRMNVFPTPILNIGALTGTSSNTITRANQALTINSSTDSDFAGVITGSGTVTKSGSAIQTFSGANTYTGSTTVSAGTLHLADGGQLAFALGATSGVSNSISGAGTFVADGDFVINTAAAAALTTGTWTLENVPSLTGPYGSTFTVVGFTDAGNDKWTKTDGTKLWTFDETTGVLTLGAGSYGSWADANAGGQGPGLDYDNDGVANGVEYFMGQTGSSFTVLPGPVSSGGATTVTWTRDPATPVSSFEVQFSATLSGDWTAVPSGEVNLSDPTKVVYTFPTPLSGKRFVRLSVTP